MIKIAVCDDEKYDREIIISLIEEYWVNVKERVLMKSFTSGIKLIESNFMPDILFLDILMSGKDGIRIGAEIKEKNPETIIIFITNLRGRMIEAFNVIHSYAYLLKPIEKENLIKILSDAIAQLERIRENRSARVNFFSENNTILEVNVADIYYFEYQNRRVTIVTKTGNYVCKDKIGKIAERMEKYGFAMCHQSFVANLVYIEGIEQGKLQMRNGDFVDLGQKRASIIRKRIIQLIDEQ